MKTITLEMKGPFVFLGKNSVFMNEIVLKSGIYIFAFEYNNKNFIEYVGVTFRCFQVRLLEHVKELLSGGYHLYDFNKLLKTNNSEFFIVWNGRYGEKKEKIGEFFKKYKKFSQISNLQLRKIKIFFIEINKDDRRFMERVEGKIYNILKENKQVPEQTKIMIKGIRYKAKKENECEINVKIRGNTCLRDIPSEFEV